MEETMTRAAASAASNSTLAGGPRNLIRQMADHKCQRPATCIVAGGIEADPNGRQCLPINR